MPTQQEYKDFLKTVKKEPPEGCKFSVGDKVTFTNDYDVSFPGLTVIGFAEEEFQGRFIYLDYDCWWFPTRPSQLTLERETSKSL